MVGIPALKKIAREIAYWPKELGEDTADKCLRQVREYLNSPPDLEGDHLSAGRDRYLTFLQEAEPMAGLDFSTASQMLGESMAEIPELADAICKMDLEKMDKNSWVEKLPYPSGWVKWLYKTPILLYRLGLGFLVGRLFMVLTTVGRKSVVLE